MVLLHALSPIEAALIHEPDLATRSWWQPTSTRAEAETRLTEVARKLTASPLSLNDLDNWTRTPALDRDSLALVRHSSTNGALAISWRRRADENFHHALVLLIFGSDGHLEGYACTLYGDLRVHARTLALLVARVLPSTPLAVDVSPLVGSPLAPVNVDVHRWSTISDVIGNIGPLLTPYVPAATLAARHVALLQLMRDKRVLRAAIDVLALDWRGVTALAGVFGRHALADELIDVAIAAVAAPDGGSPWIGGGVARPGGSVAATVLTCLVQAHCQKWLAPLLNAELDLAVRGEINDNEVVALVGKATMIVLSSPPGACPELLRVVVGKLAANRPQAGDERAFIASLVLAPFVRAFASGAIEAAAVGQSGTARKLLDATPMIAHLGENAAPRTVSLSTWRIFAPPLETALRQFCSALADAAPKRARADTAAEDVFADRIQCPVPGSDAPLDTASLDLLQRTLAPRAAALVAAVRVACVGDTPDAAICDALAPVTSSAAWSTVESLICEPLSLVGRCSLRVMSGAPLVADNDSLLAAVLRSSDSALQSASIHLLNAAGSVRGGDENRDARLRETRAFPPSSELSLMQFQLVPRGERVEPARKLLQSMLQCNEPKYDRSAALMRALDDAGDLDIVRFRQESVQQGVQLPAAPTNAPLGVAMRHSKSRESRLRRDIMITLWFGARSVTVRVPPGESAVMAVLRVSDRELSGVVSEPTWALKLAFRDQFIVGDDRRRVALCDFAWVRELVLDGRPISFIVLSSFDDRCIDGSAASREFTAQFVGGVVERAPSAALGDALSSRDIGSRQKFECTVNELVFCASSDGVDGAADAPPSARRWPALAVEASLMFGTHVLGAARRTAAGNVVPSGDAAEAAPKAKRRSRASTEKAAAATDGWTAPIDANVVGVLSIEEALVVSAQLRQLPLGTTVLWRLLSGSAVVAETTTQLFDSRDELLQGRRVFELHACDDGVARVPALRDSRAFLCVNLFMFLGDPKAPRMHVVHPDSRSAPPVAEPAELAVGKRAAPSDDERRALTIVDLADSLRHTTDAEMRLFRKYRSSLPQLAPRCLTRICDGAVDWVSPSDVDEFHALVQQWPSVEPYVAVGQLAPTVVDRAVREHAVRSLRAAALSDDALQHLLPQLIEGLRAEAFDDSALARFLLGRAAQSPLVVGCALAMAMRVELCYSLARPVEPLRKLSASVPRLQLRFALLLERLLAVSGRAASETLTCQMDAIAQLELLNRIVKPLPYGAKRSEALDKALSDSLANWPREWRSPLDPSLLCSRPSVSRSRALDSHQCPMLISMRLVETVLTGGPTGDLDDDSAAIIFKIGDDLRQDAVLLQLLHVFQDAWAASDAVDAELVLYRAMSVGFECGMVECVRHCATIAKIQATRGGGMMGALKSTPLKLFLEERTPSGATDLDNLVWSDVEDNFVRSLAAACVATCILGVADRHNDNIMMKRDGRLFHIDFGHILGRFQTLGGVIKRERAPFSLTPEMAHVLGGGDSEAFERFVTQCERAFNCARRLGPALVGLLASLLGTGLREVREEEAVLFVRASCGDVGASDEEAAQAFRRLIYESLGTLTTRLLNLSHLMAHKKSVTEK